MRVRIVLSCLGCQEDMQLYIFLKKSVIWGWFWASGGVLACDRDSEVVWRQVGRWSLWLLQLSLLITSARPFPECHGIRNVIVPCI